MRGAEVGEKYPAPEENSALVCGQFRQVKFGCGRDAVVCGDQIAGFSQMAIGASCFSGLPFFTRAQSKAGRSMELLNEP